MEDDYIEECFFEGNDEIPFENQLKTALKTKHNVFKYTNSDGTEETFNISVLNDVSEIKNTGNVIAMFDMCIQNTCVRLKHMDIFKTAADAHRMDNKKLNDGSKSSDTPSENEKLNQTVNDLLKSQEGLITIEIPEGLETELNDESETLSRSMKDLTSKLMEKNNSTASIDSTDICERLKSMECKNNCINPLDMIYENIPCETDSDLSLMNKKSNCSDNGIIVCSSNNEIKNGSDRVKCVKNENIVIHIKIPDKSEFEVILHKETPKNEVQNSNSERSLIENLMASNERVSDKINIEDINLVDKPIRLESNISIKPSDTNLINETINENAKLVDDLVKESESRKSKNDIPTKSQKSESKIDSSELPNKGKVKEMIEFFENVVYE